MAAPASRPLPSWVLLEQGVADYVFSSYPLGQGWASIELKKKEFQGRGEYGSLMAESLKLYARLAENHPDRSQLAVSADEEIIRRIVEEDLRKQASEAKSRPGLTLVDLPDRLVEFDEVDWISSVTGSVNFADKNLLVLSMSFAFSTDQYYLVYDAALASLSMIPLPRCFCTIRFPSNPPPVRYGDEYALVLFARNYEYRRGGGFNYRPVLCLWSPPPGNMYPYPSGEPWHFREPRFPEETPARFCHHVKFTSSSHAFWADLTTGGLCCRCSDLLSGGGYSVDFTFIDLPPGCKSDALDDSDTGPTEMFRTMGCTTGGSIKFVSISFDDSVPEAEKTVTGWTLDTVTWQWTKCEELRVGALWELEDFKKDGLPETEPVYPLLSTEEDDGGGALYFILSTPIREWEDDPAVHHMCRFDMRSKRLLSTPLSWPSDKFVPSRLLGCEFFRYLDSKHLVPVVRGKCKRKLDED